MSTVALPSGLLVQRQDLGIQSFDVEFGVGDTGATQVAVRAPPRLSCSLVSDDLLDGEQAAKWRALQFSLRGRVNHLVIYDILNVAPRGTLRGTLTVSGNHAASAGTMAISAGVGQVGLTLKMGDWIGVKQGGTSRQLLHVQADAVVNGSGVITVEIAPNLRLALVAGEAVTWDRPSCLMRKNSSETSWSSMGAVQGGFSLELIEAWL